MGNVQGAESPQSVYTTEYINVKTLLVQIQTAGQAVIETLTFHKHIIDEILTENERLDKSSKMKSYWPTSYKHDNDSKHQHHQMIRKALENGGILQIESLLHSMYLLDSLIQTSVKQHFSECIHQSLEETWLKVLQKRENCQSLSRCEFTSRCETNDDQVYSRVGLYSPSKGSGGRNVDATLPTSTNNVTYLNQEIRKLRDRLAVTEQEQKQNAEVANQKLQAELSSKKEHIISIEDELERLQKSLSENRTIREQQEYDLHVLRNEIDDLRNTVKEQLQETECLREQLCKKQQVELQIWFQRTDLLIQVAKEIQELVKTKCQKTANMAVNCITPDCQSDLKPHRPTLVLCIYASRLGTDVSSALSSIKCSPDVAVVVLHHKAMHALPNQSSDKVLVSPEYKQLGGIFDMAFLVGQGIYDCDFNETALKGISEFLKDRII